MSDQQRHNPPKVVTFGCRLNAYESEIISEHAQAAGIEDAIIINTCAVTNEATRQARQRIRRLAKENPDAKLIVTGCAAQIEPQTFANMTEVDLVIGNTEKLDAKSYSNNFGLENGARVRVNDIMSVRDTAHHMIQGFGGKTRAFIQIQNGCDHRCTFCIIPFGRGNARSAPAGEIVDQIRTLVAAGQKEVVLTGVDITSWGDDLPSTPNLGDLVARILKLVPDLARLRLSSIDSIEIDEQLFELITNEKRLMPHLHLSLQSGDNMILKRMKRRHTREESIAFCQAIHAVRPEITFGADFIAGFPTETEEMFQHTLDLVAECDLTFLHVFPFSAKVGTPAALMPQVRGDVIKERAARLRASGDQQLANYLGRQVATEQVLLMEKPRLGHTESFAMVELDQDQMPGAILTAKISGSDGKTLAGTSIGRVS